MLNRRFRLSVKLGFPLLLVFGLGWLAACAPGPTGSQPPAKPPQPPVPDVFVVIDKFLPQFNGSLKAAGKPALTKSEVTQALGPKIQSNWVPSPTAGEETLTAKLPDTKFGERTYSCAVTAVAAQGGLARISFVLRSTDQQELGTVEDLTHLATTHYGEPTSSLEDIEGTEWQFSDGTLSMVIERITAENTLPGEGSTLTFKLEPYSGQEKLFEKDVNRERD